MSASLDTPVIRLYGVSPDEGLRPSSPWTQNAGLRTPDSERRSERRPRYRAAVAGRRGMASRPQQAFDADAEPVDLFLTQVLAEHRQGVGVVQRRRQPLQGGEVPVGQQPPGPAPQDGAQLALDVEG